LHSLLRNANAEIALLGVVRWQGKGDPKGAVQAWEELLEKHPNYPQKQQLQEYIAKAKQHAKG